ncbi:MAG: nickel-dependent lactate racemase [Candidatus Thorarchaeota archaeon]|nr:MAG: nickel-dependent lactate racemase [Candidatus Thorarchaeota archaeon]
MKTTVLYAQLPTEIDLPESWSVREIRPKSVESTDAAVLIRRALEKPIDHERFGEFLARYESLLVIVNDHARGTPTPAILREIVPQLRGKRFGIIVASGTHALPSETDLREVILGEFYDELRQRVIFHESKNSEMIYLGTTGRGTRVEINRVVEDYDALIAINSVEPHYFAGFTGGRKSILPGIAAFDTIESNHSMALLDEARLLSLEGNPLHEDLEEAAHLLVDRKPVFAINTVQDGEGRIVQVVAGDIFKQLYVAADTAREIYAPVIERPADIVIAVVHPPFDHDLYQGAKGFENTRFAVRDGGILILVAACPGGIGAEDYAQMMTCADTPEELYQKFQEIKRHYQLGWHKVGSIPPFLAKNQLWMVTKMDSDTVARMHMRGFGTLQEAVDAAREIIGEKADVLLVHDAANVCPVVKQGA